jgi:phosphodiesterase/alkaline phosphatase D-like protein
VSATSSSISSARCETDLGSANMYVRATFGALVGAPAGTGFGVFGRVGDADSLTCYYLQIRQANNQVNLLPITNGAFGTGIGTVSHTYAPGDVFELRCFGTTISVRINDVEVISVTDSTVTSGSKAGLFANTVATNSGVRCTAWQAGLLDGSGNPVEGTPEDPIPMVLWATQVAAGTTTARISCQARNADLVRIVVADNSGLTSPVFTSSYVAPDSLELVSFEVTGLTAGTDYFYGLQVADATVDGVRNLRTAPSGQTSFIVAMSGDAGDISTSNGYPLSIKTSNSPTYARIADRDPAFFLFAGDRHYRDYNLANIPAHLLALRDTFNNPRLAGLAEQVPVMQIWDDHDYTGISDSTATGRDAAVELFRTAVPTDAWLVDTAITDPVGYTFAWGRTRWIILDHRSSRSSGNILGTAQLNAVLDLIENATEELIVLYVGVPWIAGSAPLADHWGAFTANRATIAEKIEDFAKGRVLIVHADSHMLAIDDGTNTQYDTGSVDPGPPLLSAAPVDSGSSIKGGPYSEGTVPSSAGVLVQQYATIEIDDQGSHLVVTLRGWQLDGNGIDETEVLTYEFTVGEPAASAAVDVVATISAEASTVASTTADVDVVATITAEAAVEGAEPPARTLKFVTPVVAGVRGGW